MPNVMLDPSVLVPNRFDGLSSLVDLLMRDGARVYLPGTFHERSLRGELTSETIDALLGRRRRAERRGQSLGDQSVQRDARQAELGDVRRWLASRDDLVPFQPSENEINTYGEQIVFRGETPEVAEIRLEEWIFLQSQSYLASRIKKPFTAFVRGGAVVVEAGWRGLQHLERRTLGVAASDVDPLTPVQHLRAAAKWIAVGGASAAGLVQPLLGVAVGAGAGWFLLLDP